MSNRVPDTNGWIEIKDNPLSKAGVFAYSGASIGHADADPREVYGVLRPEEELADPECVASARLLPWTNDHPERLLGDPEEGRVPAEEKGVEGVTGEDVHYDDGILYGNIKVFSRTLADDIESGKTELSMGYACVWEKEDGTWRGKPYQFVQKQIRFNHLSLVDKGRMGAEVAVLDHLNHTPEGENTMSQDEEKKPEPEKKPAPGEAKDADQGALLKTAIEALTKLAQLMPGGTPAESNPPANPAASQTDGEAPEEKLIEAAGEVIAAAEAPDAQPDAPDAQPEAKDEDKPVETEDEGKEAEKTGMDAADVKRLLRHLAVRDRMAQALKPHVGVFDHADMTLADVARYGVKKLGIQAKAGQEFAALSGYLQAKSPPRPVASAMDGKASIIDQYIHGGEQS
ncbi:MAG: DUF2213 domain-containing protein [Zoogloeaceae bacterium]|jgi:hypothetical protein|nr:DUF2213 domain-containing protein [Zoogloeaceae bacterium]